MPRPELFIKAGIERAVQSRNHQELKDRLQQANQHHLDLSGFLGKKLLWIMNMESRGGDSKPNVLKIIELLLKAGADPNVRERGGPTPLIICANNGQLKMLKLLLTYGADPDAHGLLDTLLKEIILLFRVMPSTAPKMLKLVLNVIGEDGFNLFLIRERDFMARKKHDIPELRKLLHDIEKKSQLTIAHHTYGMRPGPIGRFQQAAAGGGRGQMTTRQQQVVRSVVGGQRFPPEMMNQLYSLLPGLKKSLKQQDQF